MALNYRQQRNGGYTGYYRFPPTLQTNKITPSPLASPGWPQPTVRPAVMPNGERVDIVTTKNGNGETVEIAVDENGEVVAAKKVPPNLVPLALAAAAAFFFLM